MTIRNWLTMTLAAAMFAGATGCNNKAPDAMGRGASAGAPEGRRGGNLPQLREMDAGVSETTSGSSSGAAAASAPASGTTPGGAGSTGANGASTDGK